MHTFNSKTGSLTATLLLSFAPTCLHASTTTFTDQGAFLASVTALGYSLKTFAPGDPVTYSSGAGIKSTTVDGVNFSFSSDPLYGNVVTPSFNADGSITVGVLTKTANILFPANTFAFGYEELLSHGGAALYSDTYVGVISTTPISSYQVGVPSGAPFFSGDVATLKNFSFGPSASPAVPEASSQWLLLACLAPLGIVAARRRKGNHRNPRP